MSGRPRPPRWARDRTPDPQEYDETAAYGQYPAVEAYRQGGAPGAQTPSYADTGAYAHAGAAQAPVREYVSHPDAPYAPNPDFGTVEVRAWDPYAVGRRPQPFVPVHETQPTPVHGTPKAVVREPGYTLPAVPESAWSVSSRRGVLLGRVVLCLVLLVQAGLSLRLKGTAFVDEALYISAGGYQLEQWREGTPLPQDFAGYFSGHPKLYPVLAALVDERFGLGGVRLTSLAFMLAATALLYALTRRLFDIRSALGAAGLFSVLQSTMFLGNFATFDAAAVLLLALGAWAVVRTGSAHPLAVLLAAPPAALAFGVKYAAGLYLPTLVVLAVITAGRRPGLDRGTGAGRGAAGALGRGLLLGAGIAGLLALGYLYSEPLGGISGTTTGRAKGTDAPLDLLYASAEWGGLVFAAALGGSIAYALRARMVERPWIDGIAPGRARRIALGTLLTGTALLAPAYQIHLQSQISLFKHVGFGLLFAAPMAGLGLARLVGPHFRHPQLGILLYVSTLVFGMVQAQSGYSVADSAPMTAYLRTVVDGEGRYLADESEITTYYLRDRTDWGQWQNTFGMEYRPESGEPLAGPEAFAAAVRDARFDAIVLRGDIYPQNTDAAEKALKGNPHYRLTAVFPITTSFGTGSYRIWVKR
ncbi:glycosyltransferase family 39 protein [Streptomyces sp. NPDC060194]|uniref:glycosyltransferase family 39 protein n=1 Tax=Streptomyces sp. NPDC060194 TaxID=3347069 RepID=UPI00365190CF